MRLVKKESGAIELHDERDFWICRRFGQRTPVAVTVIIPVFNAAETLDRAVGSVLRQTMRDIEVIIVDDASTDSTWSLIGRWMCRDLRLCAIRHKQNGGKSLALNSAIQFARGAWLAVLDADDWYSSGRLAALIGLAETRGADLVADNQHFFDAGVGEIVGTAWPPRDTGWELTFDGFLDASNAYETFNLGMLKPIVRMDYIRTKSLKYENGMRHGQDFFYLLNFFLSGGSAVIADTPHYYYTQPFGTSSRRWSNVSRRRYDFKSAYEFNRRYIDVIASRLPHWQTERLQRRNDRLRYLEYFFQAKECVATHDWGGALARLVTHPEMLGYALRRIRQRIYPRPPSVPIERVAWRSRRRFEDESQQGSAASP